MFHGESSIINIVGNCNRNLLTSLVHIVVESDGHFTLLRSSQREHICGITEMGLVYLYYY